MNQVPFDPYQVFEVAHKQCVTVEVTVIRGRNITKGWAKDLMDIPDPYVILTLTHSPHSWRKTTVKDNDINPEWHETFTFWLDPEQEHSLEMSLMDANYTVDEHLATRSLPISLEATGQTTRKWISFNETSEVEIEITTKSNNSIDLRFSLTLCAEEKKFIEARKRKICQAMRKHYGLAAPRSYKEVPVIGVMGSGGGFRAMTAYSGAISALSEMGVLDMTTYIAGLSGSAWYLSQLYSHPDWPQVSPREQRQEIKTNIDRSFLWLFKSYSLTFVREVWKKRARGEPVSFTDLFGHMVGYTLLKDRLDVKLSDQRRCINDGQCPLPLYTCLHVKKCVSAMIFHEWMEFTPYEIGLPKYGTFLKTQQFSCKFFMGSIVREFPEPPLHFLQGIWGSAFCIQFKRLLQDDKNVDSKELMRREREELQEELQKDINNCDVDESESSDDETGMKNEKGNRGEKTTGGLQRRRSKSTKMKQKSFWDSMLSRMLESRWFQSIEMRAAQVFNYMRGLSLHNVFPFSPFTQTQEEEDECNKGTFGGIFDLHPTHVKKLYVVDSGLTFNSPYPILLRPQREVDIILSFDFSARPSDDTPPFKELLLAAKWAELNKVPFPPIDPEVVEKEGLKECYVFKHPWDPNCPIVLHFCLININFRRETRPGVERRTKEEEDFANFSVFDDPAHPYSTFKFTYTHEEFERLSQLVEYNTLLCRDIIFDNISTCIKRRRRFSIRRPCTKKDIARLSLKSRDTAAKLEEYINMVESVTSSSGSTESDDGAQQQQTQEQLVKGMSMSQPGKIRPVSCSSANLGGGDDDEEEREAREAKANSKLQRSTVSLRANMGFGRKKPMKYGMSQVVEEADEEDAGAGSDASTSGKESSRPVSPAVPSHPTLTRMRAVSPNMQVSPKASGDRLKPDVGGGAKQTSAQRSRSLFGNKKSPDEPGASDNSLTKRVPLNKLKNQHAHFHNGSGSSERSMDSGNFLSTDNVDSGSSERGKEAASIGEENGFPVGSSENKNPPAVNNGYEQQNDVKLMAWIDSEKRATDL